MDLTKVREKPKELLDKFIGKIKGFPKGKPGTRLRRKEPAALGNLRNTFARFAENTDVLADRFFGRFPEEKRRPMLFSLAGLAALLLILVITVLVASFRGPKKSDPADISTGPQIPSEELFIPGEPDFAPEFMLEREKRRSWSLEDIRPYWRDPASGTSPGAASSIWREEIKSAVDKLMEAVP